jgi:hypothetical protein
MKADRKNSLHRSELRKCLSKHKLIRLISFRALIDGEWTELKNSFIGLDRYIVAKKATGVELHVSKDASEGSFLQFPKRHELKRLDDKGFRFCYDDGIDLEYEYAT